MLRRPCFVYQGNALHRVKVISSWTSAECTGLLSCELPTGSEAELSWTEGSWKKKKREEVSMCTGFLLYFNFALNTFPFRKDELSNALQWERCVQNKCLLTKESLWASISQDDTQEGVWEVSQGSQLSSELNPFTHPLIPSIGGCRSWESWENPAGFPLGGSVQGGQCQWEQSERPPSPLCVTIPKPRVLSTYRNHTWGHWALWVFSVRCLFL